MDKLTTMAEAVGRHVRDGMSIAMSCSLEPLVPFAAGHEMIRQGRRDLELIGPISDSLFDQLIGAGCVRRITGAWAGNVSEGLGHNYRRAAEKAVPRNLEIHDHSNFSISLALWAAAWGSPYIPTRTLLGSDIVRSNPNLDIVDGCVHVAAVRPDLAVIHVQRADSRGRAHAWGPLGIAEEAALAATAVILTCDELVDQAVTLSDPNRVLAPENKVVAVVHEPGGAHPAPVQGYWRRDHAHFREYAQRSRTREGFLEWLGEWVHGVADRSEYLRRLSDQAGLRMHRHLLSAPADFGHE
ncbi:MAG: CoA transferase subunit A [Candidatus Dormibacteraeota bacterium]|nr:CoA transferase subunit A [Candidatus Dormibacteraeota bacterium]